MLLESLLARFDVGFHFHQRRDQPIRYPGRRNRLDQDRPEAHKLGSWPRRDKVIDERPHVNPIVKTEVPLHTSTGVDADGEKMNTMMVTALMLEN